MGKKAGKRVLNPADRERKKQRAQELKRNKKQRNTVRQAIVKGRNPDELLEQLRRLDEQEFDPTCELSKHVIIEKRAKVMVAFKQQLEMFRQEEDANQVIRLENLLHEYENDRLRKEQEHRAVVASSEVNLGEIPLPSGYMLPNAAMTPFMPPAPQAPQFKARSGVSESKKVHKYPPGPPCGLPPPFDDNIVPNKMRQMQYSSNFEKGYDDYDVDDEDLAPVAIPDSLLQTKSSFQPVRSLISAPIPPTLAPPPPSSAPLYQQQRYMDTHQQRTQIPAQNPIIAAAPVVSRPNPALATIAAEPQLRNLKKETTRFVPTALHVNKLDPNKTRAFVPNAVSRVPQKPKASATKPSTEQAKTADEKVDAFMRELEDFL